MYKQNDCKKEIILSVIIPHYNCPKLLKRLLESTPKSENIEVVIVDDNSNKGVYELEMCRQVFESENIIFKKNDMGNKGAGAARNVGLRYATGKWLAFMDADDYVIGNMLQIVDEIKERSEDIIFFRPTSINTSNGKTGKRHLRYVRLVEEYARNPSYKNEISLKFNYYTPWSKFIKRNLIENKQIKFSETLYSNDIMFSTKCAYFAQNIGISDGIFYCITENAFGLTKEMNDQSIYIRNEVTYERFCFLMRHIPIKYWKNVELNFKDILLVWGYHYHIVQFANKCLKRG